MAEGIMRHLQKGVWQGYMVVDGSDGKGMAECDRSIGDCARKGTGGRRSVTRGIW